MQEIKEQSLPTGEQIKPVKPEPPRMIKNTNDLAEALASGTLNFHDTAIAEHTRQFYAPKKRQWKKPHEGLNQRIKTAIGGWWKLKSIGFEGDIELRARAILMEYGWPEHLSCVGFTKTQVLEMLARFDSEAANKAIDVSVAEIEVPNEAVNQPQPDVPLSEIGDSPNA